MSRLQLLRNNRAIFTEFGVKQAWLFGSAARGETNAGDVDLLVDFKLRPGLLEYMNLKFRLEEILGMPVDLVTKSGCKERFYKTIEPDLIRVT
jgi:hypothetical protein